MGQRQRRQRQQSRHLAMRKKPKFLTGLLGRTHQRVPGNPPGRQMDQRACRRIEAQIRAEFGTQGMERRIIGHARQDAADW